MINIFGETIQRFGRPELDLPAGAGDGDPYFTEDEYSHRGTYCEMCKSRVYFLWVHKQKHEVDEAAKKAA